MTNILAFIHNYWVHPSNRITIKHPECKRGQYHDADYVMMYALFQMVVDFIEIECAANLERGFETRWQQFVRWMRGLPFLHWFLTSPRNARRGLYHLRWEMRLKDHPSQAQFATDLFMLYRFWKHTRPRRQDPFENYTAIAKGPERRANMDKIQAMEEAYEKEDQFMLQTIIRIRKCMWT